VDRDGFVAGMTERGVSTGTYYPRLVHDYDCYRNDPRVVPDPTPVAELAATRTVSLPVHPHLSQYDLDRIVDAVTEVLQ